MNVAKAAREAYVAQLLDARKSLHADLTGRTTPHPDPLWTSDRVREFEAITRELIRLDVIGPGRPAV
jgi:hypothetical protein